MVYIQQIKIHNAATRRPGHWLVCKHVVIQTGLMLTAKTIALRFKEDIPTIEKNGYFTGV